MATKDERREPRNAAGNTEAGEQRAEQAKAIAAAREEQATAAREAALAAAEEAAGPPPPLEAPPRLDAEDESLVLRQLATGKTPTVPGTKLDFGDPDGIYVQKMTPEEEERQNARLSGYFDYYRRKGVRSRPRAQRTSETAGGGAATGAPTGGGAPTGAATGA